MRRDLQILFFSTCAIACTEVTREVPRQPPSFEVHIDFERNFTGKLPAGWSTSGSARWGPATGRESSRGFGIVAAGLANAESVAILPGIELREFSASVSVRATAARSRGGGLCFRVAAPDRYWLARWDAQDRKLLLETVSGGSRTRRATVTADADPDEWHEIGVAVDRDAILVRLDGEERIRFAPSDPTLLREIGTFGLVVPGDSVAVFDDLRIW